MTMDRRINPFNELYVTETIPASQFVKIFSPYVIEIAEELFLPGNAILKGVQGCGKSMLLTLLQPDVRIAYRKSHESFPLTGRHGQFILAGINVTRSRAIDVGQRTIRGAEDAKMLSFYFGDFFNYWIVGDLLRSIQVLSTEVNGEIARELGMVSDTHSLDRLASELSASASWLGYLQGIDTFEGLKNRVAARIQSYLRFFGFSIPELPSEIRDSRTAVGEPLSEMCEALTKCGAFPDDLHIFVVIDQYEELAKIEAQFNEGPVYRSILHKALSLRNPHVSYRIGTRRYGFKEETLEVFGTTARLESERNYKVIDLDELLRRKEYTRKWVFPKFAEDVFRKRLKVAGYDVEQKKLCLEKVYGSGSSAEDRARAYVGKTPERALRFEAEWPDPWRKFLLSLAHEDPLSARLAEAWARQKGKDEVLRKIPKPPYPWDGKGNTVYWRKERVQAALMQIASRCYQRMIWGGLNDVIGLSGGNILVLVGICQQIWSVWLRTIGQLNRTDSSLPEIREGLQAVGIHGASTHWFDKLSEEPEGNRRQRFVSYVGTLLQRELWKDLPLSYPGRTGFSVSIDELQKDVVVSDFLNDAVDYGALFDSPHTTKEKNRRARRKWYLNPVLTPQFGIPHIRTKEPLYVSVNEVRKWINAAVELGLETPEQSLPGKVTRRLQKQQASLFPGDSTQK